MAADVLHGMQATALVYVPLVGFHWAGPAGLKKSPNWSRSWRRTELLPSPEASTSSMAERSPRSESHETPQESLPNAATLHMGGKRSAPSQVPRRRMGRAGARRPGIVGKAHAGR